MYRKNFSFLLTIVLFGAAFFQAAQIFGQVCVTPPANLVAWLPGDGDARDISGNGNNGRPSNSSVPLIFATGKDVLGFQINSGGNSTVSVPNSSSLNTITTALTIEAWVNPSTPNTSVSFTPIVDKGFGGVPNATYILNFDPNSRRVNMIVGTSSAADGAQSVNPLPLNTFTHVVGTYDGATLKMYINGVLDTSQPTTINSVVPNTGDLFIGKSNGFINPFFGTIDEVSLYNRALSASEIQAIYNAGASGKCKSLVNARIDFDGDGKVDLGVFRPSNGTWYVNRSTSGFYGVQFGASGDKLAPADYDGDGKSDIAVWREGSFSYFYILQSSNNTFRYEQFGQTGDSPIVVGDWDGDGKADPAIYRAATTAGGQSFFYYRPSTQPGVNFIPIRWGTNGDEAVRGDFDGDGKLDAAIYRASDNYWYVRRSSDGTLLTQQWGTGSDKRVSGDFDGDGKTDFAVFRPSIGGWYVLQSSNNQARYQQFGLASDQLAAGDFDGDGRADFAVFRPSNGTWYILNSSSGNTQNIAFGQNGDIAAVFTP